MKNVVLLGSTGSIGTSTVKVAGDLPDQIRLIGLAAGGNAALLLEQTRTPVPNPKEEIKLKEGDTTYTIRRTKLELSDRDGQAVQGLFEIRVTAEWLEGREVQQATAETWVFPPLFEP